MADVSELSVKISLNLKEFSKKLKTATANLDRVGKKFRDVGKKLTIGLTLPIVAAGVAAIKLASSAEESASKFRLAFGSATKETNKALEDFAKVANRNSFALKDMAANLGVLLRPMGFTAKETSKMSTEFTKLAVDLASLFEVSEQETLTALRAGIVGEAEPLRRLGVQLNQVKIEQEAFALGLAKTKDEITPLIKTQAIFSIVMKETSAAQGDASRTAGSFANSLKGLTSAIQEAGVNIGKKLLPSATKLVNTLKNLVREFDDLSDGVKDNIILTAGILATIGPLTFALGGLAAAFLAIKIAVVAVSAAFVAAVFTFSTITVAIGLVIAAGVLLIKNYKEMGLGIEKIFLKMTRVAIQSTRGILSVVALIPGTAKLSEAAFLKLNLALNRSDVALASNQGEWIKLLVDQSGVTEETERYIKELGKQKKALDQVGESINLVSGRMKKFQEILKGVSRDMSEPLLQADVFGETIETLDAKINIVKTSMLKFASTFGKGSDEFKIANDSLIDLTKQLEAMKKVIGEGEAFKAMQESFTKAKIEFELGGTAIAKLKADIATLMTGIQTLTPTLGFNSDAVQFLVEKYRMLSQQLVGLMEKTKSFGIQIAEVIVGVAVAGFNKLGGAIAQTLVDGKNFGDQMKVIFKDMVKSVISELIKLIVKLTIVKALMAAIGFATGGATAIPLGGGGFGGFGLAARGGVVNRPTPLIAGEAGPEAIIPLDRLNEFGGGGGSQTIIFEMDGRTLASETVQHMPSLIRLKAGIRGI